MATEHDLLPAVSQVLPVSVIISTRNRQRMVLETVNSVLGGSRVPAELLIVDQSSEPDAQLAALGTVCGCRVRHLWTGSRGLSRARNVGVMAARHELLVFVDDDMWVDQHWLSVITSESLAAGPGAIVTGRVLPAMPQKSGHFVSSVVLSDVPAVFAEPHQRYILAGGNMALHRALIDKVGLFDCRLGPGSSFPAAEDNDFGFRCLTLGCRIIYVPAAVLYHRAWRRTTEFLPLRFNYGRGQGAFYAKHRLRKQLGVDICRRLVQVPVHALRLRSRAVGNVAFVAGLLTGYGHWLLGWLEVEDPNPPTNAAPQTATGREFHGREHVR